MTRSLPVAAVCLAALGLVAAAPAPAPAPDTYSVNAWPQAEELPPSCDSKIYCQGLMLHVVQTAGLFKDSKTFVDMKLKYSVNETEFKFRQLMEQTGNNPSRDDVQKFVDDCFEAGNELQPYELTDWVESPQILNKIADPNLRDWASDLNGIWRNLSRRVSPDVQQNSELYSLIYVPNHFIIPGGRFRELYYWDTYWIVRGLLLSEMKETVRGVLENFLYLLKNYGIIPNGGRVYYLQRTQPPLLVPMVYSYYVATKDLEFVRNNIELLEHEFHFWLNNRTTEVVVDGRTYRLARFYAPSEGPRPESYREDYDNAQVFPTDERKTEFYIDLKSAAESGWDFSCRWFIKNGTNEGNLTDIHTTDILPVDINAFLYWNAALLAKLFRELGDSGKYIQYISIAEQWKEAVHKVLWNEEDGTWYDYDMLNNKQRQYFYPSNLAPLWTKCYDKNKVGHIAEKVVQYIDKNGIDHYLGGIPTSLIRSGEQWDLPNAWPPLQSIIIQGLEYTKHPSAQKLALKLAEQWVHANYKGFADTQDMFEKYDAENPGKYGGGGEYEVQSGFGWTNGCILELLNTYGLVLNSGTSPRQEKGSVPAQ